MAKLNFRHMEIFWAVMTTGSATAAARLESITQLVLFKRANARLIPTEQALRLFEEVERAYFGMERIERTAEAIRQHKHGQIALVTLPAFSQALLPRVCKRFLGQYPDVALSITPQEAPLLNEWLSSQRYDLGLIEEATVPIGTESDCVFTSDMVCVLPTDHRLADKSVLSPRDFEGEPFISVAANDPYRKKIDSLFQEHGISRRLVVETHSAVAVCSTVAHGVGVSIIPYGWCARCTAPTRCWSTSSSMPCAIAARNSKRSSPRCHSGNSWTVRPIHIRNEWTPRKLIFFIPIPQC